MRRTIWSNACTETIGHPDAVLLIDAEVARACSLFTPRSFGLSIPLGITSAGSQVLSNDLFGKLPVEVREDEW